MRALIIGGTGFIGPYVVQQLLALGHEVTVYHRGQHESAAIPQVRHFRSPDAGIPVLRFPPELVREEFEVVINMIAMGEADARAAVQTFADRTGRLVVLSSGDVYAAYGRFSGLEVGSVEESLLTEDSPLRTVFYPYRSQAKSEEDLSYFYEKILVEREVFRDPRLPATVLRLPKVYGRGGNGDLATMYAYREHPNWRWTHGYVENVAAAIVLAALSTAAANRVYTVGEVYTPTVEERLANLPPSDVPPAPAGRYDFRHSIAYDTTRIRTELGYTEPVAYDEGIRRTLSR
jgi:nucleoside-diphosphate-sugar epimerase